MPSPSRDEHWCADVERQDPQGQGLQRYRQGDEPQPFDSLREETERDDVTGYRAGAKAGEEKAGDLRVRAEALDHEHRHCGEERLPGCVARDEERDPDA
jgi:hypothetical protein